MTIEFGEAVLIVYGYVDYIDQFGERHRGGYGRWYIPATKGNNLGFPEITSAVLNFDRPRTKGEGSDWD